MEYINLHVSVIDSAEFKVSTPEQQGTFLCLLRYVCGQENGDRIVGCGKWPAHAWRTIVGVDHEIVHEACGLWSWEGEDLEVNFYPDMEEKKVRAMRRGGRIGNKRRWASKKQPRESPPDKPPEQPREIPPGIAPRIGNEMKGNEMKRGTPEFHEICVPSVDEFKAACELRGVPDWYAEQEHAWRSERPAGRWPSGANWQTAVTSTFTRWRSNGSPTEPGPAARRNGVNKTAGAWELSQRLEALREQERRHPANENSASWTGEPTEHDLATIATIRREIRQCESALAGHSDLR